MTDTTLPPLDVLTVGEAMALFIAEQPGPLSQVSQFRRATAGAELNVAIGLARLGLRVGYLTRLGTDSLGEHVLHTLRSEGVDERYVTRDEAHSTGFMLKSRETDGRDPQIEYHRQHSAARQMGPADQPTATGRLARHLHLTGIPPALSPSLRQLVFHLAGAARAQGMSISFDPNLRPRLWASPDDMLDTLNQLASLSDWILPGLAEGQLLSGRERPQDVAEFFLAQGAQRVIVKLGAAGAWYAEAAGGASGPVPGCPVPAVLDSVGAGDGFAVGVISALLEGARTAAAVARGNAIGARVVQFPGDSDGLPTRDELQRLMTEPASSPLPA